LKRRRQIASFYDTAFSNSEFVKPLRRRDGVTHAHHLYVVRLGQPLAQQRMRVFAGLRAEGIGVNVHYIPVHYHPFYRRRFGTASGMLPVSERAYEEILTLPLFPQMSDQDASDVVEAVTKVSLACAG
jgi:perosamine synthetase